MSNEMKRRKPRKCKDCGKVFNMNSEEIREHEKDHDRKVIPIRGIQIAQPEDLMLLERSKNRGIVTRKR